MANLSQLLNRLPDIPVVRMSTMGHAVWVCWQKTPPAAVNQTLLNYGGMLLTEEGDQALWFFFTDDAFLALARLSVWGNFNELAVAIEIFPGRLQFGARREMNLWVDGKLAAQSMMVRENLEVWVHPKSREGKNTLPGIDFEKTAPRQGIAQLDWALLKADVRMPYTSTQSWFAILHPLGSPLDKEYQTGWPAMFERLESLFQEHKMRFIVHETFVMVAVENLLMLRTFLRDYLQTFDRESDQKAPCWPCVCVVTDRKNFNFNNDLPKKVGLKWDSLMPDFPYLSYRNAYLLGEGFTIRDIAFSGDQSSIDSWCNIILDENSVSHRSIPLLMAGHLASSGAGDTGCFYCGIRTHTAAQCPTRTYAPSRPQIWDELAALDLDTINEGFRQIEHVLVAKGLNGYGELLNTPGPTATLLQAVLDLNGAGQLRNVPRQWLYRMRDADENENVQRDDSPAWDFLDKLAQTPPEGLLSLEKAINESITRHSRDPRLRTVLGFLQVERGDYAHAPQSFREAASLTPSPALQAWNEYLQGRLHEELGHYAQALEQYAQVLRLMPQWHDLRYREIVCKVKMGFGEQVLDQIAKLVKEEPAFFNRILIDPALERGRLLILSSLYDLWDAALSRALDETGRINEMEERLGQWFEEDHPVHIKLGKHIAQLKHMSEVKNYTAFLRVVEETPPLEKELDECIQHEVDDLRERYKGYLERLQEVRDEASWFPFPSALKEFSQEFNECAGIINWAFACNFNDAATFKRAQSTTPRLNQLLRDLRKRLKFLRMVRDVTLFVMTMGKTFLWVELAGLLFCFLGVPAVVLWGQHFYMGWLRDLIGENQWGIQKVLVFIVSVIALGIAALRSTLVFDSKREKLLNEAREQREKAQQMRLDRIRRQRQMEAENARRMQEAEAERQRQEELRRRMEDN